MRVAMKRCCPRCRWNSLKSCLNTGSVIFGYIATMCIYIHIYIYIYTYVHFQWAHVSMLFFVEV